jgi:hypothetical protein
MRFTSCCDQRRAAREYVFKPTVFALSWLGLGFLGASPGQSFSCGLGVYTSVGSNKQEQICWSNLREQHDVRTRGKSRPNKQSAKRFD